MNSLTALPSILNAKTPFKGFSEVYSVGVVPVRVKVNLSSVRPVLPSVLSIAVLTPGVNEVNVNEEVSLSITGIVP